MAPRKELILILLLEPSKFNGNENWFQKLGMRNLGAKLQHLIEGSGMTFCLCSLEV